MRDVIAGIVAVALLIVAASLATTLRLLRRRRQHLRNVEQELGRTIIAEVPDGDDLILFTEDAQRFYYGQRAVDKDLIAAVRVLINGSPIAAYESHQAAGGVHGPATSFEDRPEGIARDRWDVAIELTAGTTNNGQPSMLVPCGAIRERVSQELARAVFDAVKRELERRDRMK
jgi:hypothetical protein